MSAPPAPAAEQDLPHWLSAQWARYATEPSSAVLLLPPARQVFAELLARQPEPDPASLASALELGLLIGMLASELRDSNAVRAEIAQALAWSERHEQHPHRVELLCLQARADIQAQRFDRVAPQLARAHELAVAAGDVCGQGLVAFGWGQLALRQREHAQAVLLADQAIAHLQASGWCGPWGQIYAVKAVAQRELGDAVGRRATLLAGIALGQSQRRWSEAVNMLSGLIDMDLEAGAVDQAEQGLLRCQALLQQGPEEASLGQFMLRFSQARCHAARGQFELACREMQAVLDLAAPCLAATELATRLEQLADIQSRAGRALEALASTRQAHQLLLTLHRDAALRDARLLRQRIELDQAESSRQAAEAHARELAVQNLALDQALQRQRELQTELIESSKLASLGQLLVGVAHELNTPLDTALGAVSGALECSQGMRSSLDRGAVSRSRLMAELLAAVDGGEQAQQQLQRALELVAGYKELQARERPPEALLQRLDLLVQTAWQRVLAPGAALRLELDAGLELRLPADALLDVLVQLFQNVARHAYAPGAPGLVRVQARLTEGQVVLSVADQGRGIAPELLPRIFEPYVSSQFGQGRSGLGLFVARAAIKRRLGGQIRAFSEPGAGSRFEIEWPAAASPAP